MEFYWKKKFDSILNTLRRFIKRSKIQIEIEKLKWKLKKKYCNLGEYVAEKKSIVDFSHDEIYQKKIDEIIKLQFYIKDQKSSK